MYLLFLLFVALVCLFWGGGGKSDPCYSILELIEYASETHHIKMELLMFFIKPARLVGFSLFLITLPAIFTLSGNILALPSNLIHNFITLHHLHCCHQV